MQVLIIKLTLWSTGSTNRFLDVTQTGLYSVTVTDSSGCQGYDFVDVTVITHALPAFAIDSSHISYLSSNTWSEKYWFKNLSQNADLYKWDFNGDGTIDTTLKTKATVNYTYSLPYNYNATLIAENSCFADTSVIVISVINDSLPPVAKFKYTINNLNVNFINESYNARRFKWTFSDSNKIDTGSFTEHYAPLTMHSYCCLGEFLCIADSL